MRQETAGGGRSRAVKPAGAEEGTGRRRRLEAALLDSFHGDAEGSKAEATVGLVWLGAVLIDGGELGAHGPARVVRVRVGGRMGKRGGETSRQGVV